MRSVRLRPLRLWDAIRCYRLACDPTVRAMSFSASRPTLLGHLRWMLLWLSGNERLSWSIIDYHWPYSGWMGLVRIGPARYPSPDGMTEHEIHIALFHWARGGGVGPRALRGAVGEWASLYRGNARLVAYMRSNNMRARIAFASVGFRLAAAVPGQEDQYVRMVYHNPKER